MRRLTLPLVILGCIALAAILAWLVVSSAGFGGRAARSEAAPSETGAPRVVPSFTRIEIAGNAEVTLVQGNDESVALPAIPKKGGGYVSAEVRNGTLYIEAVDRSHWWDIAIGGSSRPLPIVVSFKTLKAITAAGTVRLNAASLKADDLKVTGAGGTAIRIDDLSARQLHLTGAGALRADVAGRVDQQEVTISGAGDFRGGKLVSRDATVNVAGAGKVLVNVEQTLDATISGAGSVEYVGDPKVTQRVSGVGRVKRRESAALTFAHEAV
jgi:hypothetical protein